MNSEGHTNETPALRPKRIHAVWDLELWVTTRSPLSWFKIPWFLQCQDDSKKEKEEGTEKASFRGIQNTFLIVL